MGADDQLFQRFGKEFPQGTVLFREGETGREMYVIQSGKVSISKKAGDSQKVLTVLGAGEFFGEMSILNNLPRSASATCEEDTKLLVIDPKTFEAMVRGNAEIALRMIKKLADRLQEADHQIENLLMRSGSTRVVHFLLMAAEKGTKGPSGVKLPLSVAELAARLNTETGPINEVIAKLAKSGIIAVEPDGFLVPDVLKLRQFLEFLQMKEQFGEAG